MYKIAIIGSKDYTRAQPVLKLFKKIKDTFGKTPTIISSGEDTFIERLVKKTAIDLELVFKEYNPSYTGYKMYSAMDKKYYDKNYHLSHVYDRYKHLVINSEYLFIFMDEETTDKSIIEYVIKLATRKKIPIKIIN